MHTDYSNKSFRVHLKGVIVFDVEDLTKKHVDQGAWKRTCMVFIGDSKSGKHKYNSRKFKGDECEYYSWFIKHKYGIELTKPIRGAHISFINDRMDEMTVHTKTNKDRIKLWEKVKKKWDGKEVDVVLDVRPDTSTKTHWWLIVPHDERGELQSIRDELGFINPKTGLSKPYFGMHMTIGSAVDKVESDSFHYWREKVDTGTNKTIKRSNVAQSEYIIKMIKNGLSNY